ncbi:MAG: NAD(+) diphosphatase [Rhizobiaceae bacterium]
MNFPFFDAPQREPSQFVGFAGNRIDRQSENRAEETLAAALADPDARILLTRAGRIHLKLSGETFDPHYSLAEARELGAKLEHAVLLGRSQSGPVIAAPAGRDAEELPANIKAIDYRSVYIQGLVGPEELGELAQGASLLHWNHTHRFCGRCGAKTEMRIGGYKRICTGCQAEHFPRTDPVAIMLAVRRDHCLLGRSPHFMPNMYSALAGFLEPGETIEQAVRRETLEESGIEIGRVVYHASQPWPFPHTLMIGCFGEATSEEISFDGDELEDCRWFSRDEVRSVLAGDHPDEIGCPPPGAIAHHLIRAWAESD